jgi:hypothetical protein
VRRVLVKLVLAVHFMYDKLWSKSLLNEICKAEEEIGVKKKVGEIL